MDNKLIIFFCCLIFSVQSTGACPAVFIFGDSTADVGTNNYLNGTATANNLFYGIDYPYSKATGRFSNGYNTADLIVRELGIAIESPPPFLALLQNMSSFNSSILQGVNFASGGSGIFNDTGNQTFGEVIPLGQQIQQFAMVSRSITELLGDDKATDLLSGSLYIISVGSNDFFDKLKIGQNISDPNFVKTMQNAYVNYLKTLYDLGARKFGIVSVPPIGCVPAILYYTGGTCMDELNIAAQAFYVSLETMMKQFNASFTGVEYSLGNTYLMTMNVIHNPRASGLIDVKNACCGTGSFNGQDKCTNTSNLCCNHNDHLFWDWFHPTQYVSQLAALTLVYGEDPFVTPMNFSQLAMPK